MEPGLSLLRAPRPRRVLGVLGALVAVVRFIRGVGFPVAVTEIGVGVTRPCASVRSVVRSVRSVRSVRAVIVAPLLLRPQARAVCATGRWGTMRLAWRVPAGRTGADAGCLEPWRRAPTGSIEGP